MSQTVSAFLLKNLKVKTRSGTEWLCLCPYHEDNSPSFSFNIKKRVFVCFACGAKGNLRQLMEHLGVNSDIRGEEKQVSDVMEKIAQTKVLIEQGDRPAVGVPYPLVYRSDGELIKRFWEVQRGLNRGQVKTYELGFDPINNHAIIPVRDFESGVYTSLIRRRIGELEAGQSRYLYSKGAKISEMVFGAYEARKYIESPSSGTMTTLIITEGAIDAMTPYNMTPIRGREIIGGVAVLGSRMSKRQGEIIRAIGAREIIIATDMDRAGRIAQTQIATMLKDLKCGSIIYKAEWDSKLGKDLNEVSLKNSFSTVRGILEETIGGRPIPSLFTPPKTYKQTTQELFQ